MNRKLAIYFIFAFFIELLFVGCSLDGKKHYLEKFGEFVAHVTEHGSDYSDADWRYADQQFRLYTDVYLEKYRHELTDEEFQRIDNYMKLYTERRAAVEWERIWNSELQIESD